MTSLTEPVRRFGVAGAIAGVGLAVLSVASLQTRPPCYPGYVRLIDVELVGPPLALFLALVSGALSWRAGRGRAGRVAVTAALITLALIGLGVLATLATMAERSGQTYDSSCWTF